MGCGCNKTPSANSTPLTGSTAKPTLPGVGSGTSVQTKLPCKKGEVTVSLNKLVNASEKPGARFYLKKSTTGHYVLKVEVSGKAFWIPILTSIPGGEGGEGSGEGGGTPGTGGVTAEELLALLLTVDGAGSGLDADLLDGLHATSFLRTANNLSDVTNPASARVSLGLGPSGVTAGSYTNCDLTVDSLGRITLAANGTGGGGGSMTALEILALLLTVDGPGSGLNADLLDGYNSTAFSFSGHGHSYSDISGLGTLATQSGTFSGTSSGTNTGDQDLSGLLVKSANLSDLVSASTARTNLGLGTLATQSGTFSGTSSGTNTGDQTITLTGDVTGSGTGPFAATLANNAVSFAKFVAAESAGFVGATGAGNYAHRTPTQVTADLSAMVGDSGFGGTKGLVPAPAAGDAAAAKYLKADGTWATVSGGGSPGGSTTQVQFNNAGAFGGVAGLVVNTTTGALTQSQTTDATTAVYGLTAATSSAATSGNQKWSPAIKLSAAGYGTTAGTSQDVSFDFVVQPTQSTVPTGTLAIRSSIAGGAWTDIASVSSARVWKLNPTYSFGVTMLTTASDSLAWFGRTDVPNNRYVGLGYDGSRPPGMKLAQTGGIVWSTSTTDASSGFGTYLISLSSANLRQGAADAASPVAQTFSVQSVAAGTSNTAGVNRTFSASQGTGTGAGGNILFTVAPPSGSSGSTQNALVTALTIKGDAERCVEVEKLLSIVARAVSTLPSAATYAGCCANVNDALTPVAGTTVAGGGAARALVWSDGTNWKVVIA